MRTWKVDFFNRHNEIETALKNHKPPRIKHKKGERRYSVPRLPPMEVPYYTAIIFVAMYQKRITYDEVEAKSGVSIRTLWTWRSGVQYPKTRQLFEVYKALGIKYRVWISGVDD